MKSLRPVLVVLLAFGAMVYRLDGQSFWSDEGASVFMTGRNFGEILQAAASDIHPPLYYLLLRYWSVPTGTSEFAVRFLSLAFGLLLVALVYKLGEKLASRDVGLVAAFLAATSPFLIYYSQEARMYAQMAALSTLSVVLALKIWQRLGGDEGKRERGEKGKRWDVPFPFSPFTLLPYILATAACLYTQYYSFTIVLFEDMVFALVFWRVWRHWRGWLVWIAGQLVVAILYLPWVIRVAGQLNSWPAISETFSLQTLAYRVFLVFSFGLSWDMTATAKTQVLFLGLLVVGVLLGGRGKGEKGEDGACPSSVVPQPSTLNPQPFALNSQPFTLYPLLFALLYLSVPIFVMYYLSLSRPMYNPKFLLLATPPFYLLLGMGVIALRDIVAGTASRMFPAEASTSQNRCRANVPVGAVPPCPPPSPPSPPQVPSSSPSPQGPCPLPPSAVPQSASSPSPSTFHPSPQGSHR
ncbi:MAG: glycosyltransferase family 39 protein, partial [Dehalococcoidia bacterium]|nr:glycosyltransferase family 39 protein [Dehalococcoidia bacterium]